eukprot:5740985-Ditylum_brightwellii.AAC.2
MALQLQQGFVDNAYCYDDIILKYKDLNHTVTDIMLSSEMHCCHSKQGYIWPTKLAVPGKLV